ncbi:MULTISPECIES: Mov34/MPN/PAD-1 family protein [Methanobacterium]|jgi:proteasome lid subunit RPN8/RPN11|uniref:Mov34/MPN/PAD-1 family protein n=1 Tax=Methanobacterium formicicum TaxID=2162 RepID=A0A090I2A6_METFO|nr:MULTISPECIES: Mov34/MPN/PAD-1 family protein [Methanobacterium]AIS31639.1 Mov34/MPN/PAD-1 family protein [Methanobacterium formicicum]KUK74607.1 MAG: Mov34/MPN/PAD-1 family protein [Methanobacterium sp. 42_16]MBF4475858.1 Mov34/MPN/PAD-1 family protein [Methanobacterium formicicum]MDD4810974.1 Mov34/MPN/PAD-1 family protein [Methanobacterium formicicum]MDG3548060.1 Mov34/MPN/PAD-1 family protein [Methanobacterium formicicum]
MAENKNWIDRFLGFLLGNNGKKFEEVILDREVVGEIIQIARESHPLEFVALLEGKIKEKILRVDGLVFLPGETSHQGAVMKTFMMPLTTGTVGSVHSHPTPSASPSTADLHFFAKNGLFHLIIAYPYTEDSIIAYDTFGELADYRIL